MPRKSKAPFLPVSRTLFESDAWLNNEFTPVMAWLDINYLAAYERTAYSDGNRTYELNAGQLRTTLDKLANRWNWNRKRVWRQLCLWKRNGLVHTEGDTRGYTITIENYGFAELQGNTDVHASVHANGTQVSTQVSTPVSISTINTTINKKELRREENNTDFVPYKDPKTGMTVVGEFVDRKTGMEYVKVKI